jgi:hypothetical protein
MDTTDIVLGEFQSDLDETIMIDTEEIKDTPLVRKFITMYVGDPTDQNDDR